MKESSGEDARTVASVGAGAHPVEVAEPVHMVLCCGADREVLVQVLVALLALKDVAADLIGVPCPRAQPKTRLSCCRDTDMLVMTRTVAVNAKQQDAVVDGLELLDELFGPFSRSLNSWSKRRRDGK